MSECNTCKEEKDTVVFGQCDECFEKEMKENGSVIYHEWYSQEMDREM